MDWGSHVGELAFYGLFSPFLRLQAGVTHIIGLVILFVGIRIAWRIAGGTEVESIPTWMQSGEMLPGTASIVSYWSS